MIVTRDTERVARSADTPPDPSAPFISIVTPALNEEHNVVPLVERITRALAALEVSCEIIFVSDGSDDGTCAAVAALHARDPRIKLLHLSRPFGHQAAILAGLDHARGRVVVTMDADLQHPPEAIPGLLERWQAGADVVHAVRRPTRLGNPLIRRGKRLGYGMLRWLCEVDIIPGSADFRLYDRRAVNAMCAMREQNRFNRGLARWIGFEQDVLPIDEAARHSGRAKYSLVKLLRLLLNGVFSLSSKPLQYVGLGGLALSIVSSVYLVLVVAAWLFNLPGYRAISGWPSTIAAILCMGGIQLTAIWLMAQYLARTYDEVKGRPAYIVAHALGIACPTACAPEAKPRTIPRTTERYAGPIHRRVVELETHAHAH